MLSHRHPPLVHAILALLLLIAATVLAVYKPFGMTPYGTRQQIRGRMPAQGPGSRPVQDVPGGTARSWEYLLWFAVLAIVGLVILSHLLRSGAHGH